MDLKTNQVISNEINTSLQNLPKYFLNNFVEDCIQINTILNSELRNPTDFKSCINLLRVILRDNKDIFCPLFENLIYKYLSLLSKENLVPEEYIFLLVDIIHNKSDINKYFKKWILIILEKLLIFCGYHMEEKENQQIINILKYIQYLFDEYILSNDDCINTFMNFFDSGDLKLQEISAYFFFKYINLYDINKIKLIDWKFFFEKCTFGLENKLIEEQNKTFIKDIFKQIFIYFQAVKVDPNDALIEGGSISAAKYFEQINNFNTEKAKAELRSKNVII